MKVSTMIDSKFSVTDSEPRRCGQPFKEALMADRRVSSQLSREKIDRLLDPEKYAGFSKEFVDCLTGKK